MALHNLVGRNNGGKSPVSVKYQNPHSFKEGMILLCQKYPWNETNVAFTWLSFLYNLLNA